MLKKLEKDVHKIRKVAEEKSNKEELNGQDAKELLEVLQMSSDMNRAMILSIKGGRR